MNGDQLAKLLVAETEAMVREDGGWFAFQDEEHQVAVDATLDMKKLAVAVLAAMNLPT